MDHDLIAATLGVLGLALMASVLGYRLGLALHPQVRIGLFAASLVLASVYAAFMVGRLELVGFFPGGNAVLQSNATPILILFATGLAWTIPSTSQSSRRFRFAVMAGLSVLFFFSPWLRPQMRPVVSDEQARFNQGVCLQSHSATCAAAAAATLLSYHGMPIAEHDMIRHCLTSRDGTEPLGLYRGLSVGTAGRRFTPMLASKHSLNWQALGQYPLIALVSFRDDEQLNSTPYRRLLGRQGDGHAIVVFGQKSNGDFLIGDPATGRTIWDQATFQRRFFGAAIFLAKRPLEAVTRP